MMKKFWLSLSALLIVTTCFSQGYKLTIKFSHYTPQKVRLAYYYEEKQYLAVDSAPQSGSTVVFEGDHPLPGGIYSVILDGDKNYFDILIDKDNQNFTMKCDTKNPQKTMKITGSDVNAKFFDYQRDMTALNIEQARIDTLKKYEKDSSKIPGYDKQLAEIDSAYQKALRETIANNKGNMLSDMLDCLNATTHPGNTQLEHVNFSNEALLRTPFFYKVIRAHIARHIEEGQYEIMRQNDLIISKAKANTSNYHYVTSYLLNFYRSFYKLGINEVFVRLADKYFLADTVKNLSEEIRQMIKEQRDIYAASMVGSKAVNLRVRNTITGDSLNIFDNIKDKLLLLFWANGCGHCDSAENAIKFYYNNLINKNITVISVTNDKHSYESLKYNSEKKNFPWVDCCDVENLSRYREYYYVVSTPVLYVIDKDGYIIHKTVGEDRITETVQRLSQ